MLIPHPVTFNPNLKSEYLALIAGWLLEELYATEDDLSRSTDTAYTRGCTAFGRQKSRLMKEALAGKHSWLSLCNGGNDLVFEIGRVPCRFANDDPNSPQKLAVLTANRYQTSFMDDVGAEEPARFCFVIDRGHSELDEPSVQFLGFTTGGSLACRWDSTEVRQIRVATPDLPKAVDVPKPAVTPKKKADDGTAEEVAG